MSRVLAPAWADGVRYGFHRSFPPTPALEGAALCPAAAEAQTRLSNAAGERSARAWPRSRTLGHALARPPAPLTACTHADEDVLKRSWRKTTE